MRAFLAQSVERAAFNRKVVGSRPTGGVFLPKGKENKGKEIVVLLPDSGDRYLSTPMFS